MTEKSCDGLFCDMWRNCPVDHKPIEFVMVDHNNRLLSCRDLCCLYEKFVEIGKIKKEKKDVNRD